jgi:hypothetical protein
MLDTGRVTEGEQTRLARIASNEAVFRTVNEQIQELNRALGETGGYDSMGIVCECGDIGCTEQITIPIDTYENLRSDSTLFIIVPGHEIPDARAAAGLAQAAFPRLPPVIERETAPGLGRFRGLRTRSAPSTNSAGTRCGYLTGSTTSAPYFGRGTNSASRECSSTPITVARRLPERMISSPGRGS